MHFAKRSLAASPFDGPLRSVVYHFCLVLISEACGFCYGMRGISSNGRQSVGKSINAALWGKPMATEGMRCCGLSISVFVSVGAISMDEKQTRCAFEVVEVRLPPTNRSLFVCPAYFEIRFLNSCRTNNNVAAHIVCASFWTLCFVVVFPHSAEGFCSISIFGWR